MAIFKKKGNKKEAEDKQSKDQAKKEAKSAGKQSMKDLYQDEQVVAKPGKKAAKKTAKKVEIKVNPQSRSYRILQHPLVTEKSAENASINKYTFAVDIKTNKVEIAKAVKELYGTLPVKVNIVKMEGKIVQRGRFSGKRKDWKKAIITLPKGKTIDIYEGV